MIQTLFVTTSQVSEAEVVNIIAPTPPAPTGRFSEHDSFREEWWMEADQAVYIQNALMGNRQTANTGSNSPLVKVSG